MKPTGFIPGSPPDVLRRLKHTVRKMRQLLRDTESCNDNNPNFRDCPMDTGADRVLIYRGQACIEQIERDGFVDEGLWRTFIAAVEDTAKTDRT